MMTGLKLYFFFYRFAIFGFLDDGDTGGKRS